MITISAFEVLDAIVAILVIVQFAPIREALAALMAHERFLARVAAIVNIEMVLPMGGVIASIASVPLLSIHRPSGSVVLIKIENLFALFVEH